MEHRASLFARLYLSFFLPSAFVGSIAAGKSATNEKNFFREHRQSAAVQSDERSRYRDHRVEPRVMKSSVDAVSDVMSSSINVVLQRSEAMNTTRELLRRGSSRRRGSRDACPGQIGRKRIVRRRVEADVSVVLLVEESAGEWIRLVINHASDAERIDVAERTNVIAVGLPFLLVILPPQVILETVCRGVSAIVRRKIGQIAPRNWTRPVGGVDSRIVRSFEELSRWPSNRSAIVSSLWSMVGIQGLQSRCRRVTWSIRIVIVARTRRVDRSRSDGRRSVITGSNIITG
ncbi:unnamed protein product [Lasius platythorax]|uniref:Uncharacterized protein n=1 Tax=Lasius platythorax TaxID=488582 RepID=A0AAV2NLI1_9HYME